MNFVTARHNPFATDQLHTIPFRFIDGDWNDHLLRLATLGYRAAIVGQRGSGKSTLLRALTQHLPMVGQPVSYVYLPFEKSAHKALLAEGWARSMRGAVLLVDGMERLSICNRFRLLRATASLPGLIVTQHHNGRLPTWFHCQTSQTLLRGVLQDMQITQPEIIAAAERAFEHSQGNIRDALRELYSQYSRGTFSLTTAQLSSNRPLHSMGESSNV